MQKNDWKVAQKEIKSSGFGMPIPTFNSNSTSVGSKNTFDD